LPTSVAHIVQRKPLEVPQHESKLVHYRTLSVADAEALMIARADSAVLLTGDGSSCKAALDAGVDVRGALGELKRRGAG